MPISLRRCWNRLAGERRHSRPPAAASHCHDHTASDTTCYTYPLSTPAHPPEAPQTGLYSSVLLLLGLASLISRPALRHCACSADRTGAEMLAAAAAARPVPLRRPGALLRAPVPCSLPASRVAAPFPRRSGTEWLSSFDVLLNRSYASEWDGRRLFMASSCLDERAVSYSNFKMPCWSYAKF